MFGFRVQKSIKKWMFTQEINKYRILSCNLSFWFLFFIRHKKCITYMYCTCIDTRHGTILQLIQTFLIFFISHTYIKIQPKYVYILIVFEGRNINISYFHNRYMCTGSSKRHIMRLCHVICNTIWGHGILEPPYFGNLEIHVHINLITGLLIILNCVLHLQSIMYKRNVDTITAKAERCKCFRMYNLYSIFNWEVNTICTCKYVKKMIYILTVHICLFS